MNKSGCEILEMFFNGYGKDKKAFIYQLKQPCDVLSIIINDKNNCWDVIAYNRFFYDYDNEDELNICDELLIR